MKILYINALYSPHVAGGAEISLKLIVEQMQAKGHEVAVLSLVPEQGRLYQEWVNGVKVYRVGLKNRYWPFTTDRPNKIRRLAWHLRDRNNAFMRSDVRQVLESEQPDVVSCHNLVGWSIAVWHEVKRAGIPIVQVLHDMYLLCANSNMYKNGHGCTRQCFSCRMLRYDHRQQSQQVNAVVGISRSILDRFTKSGYFANTPQYVIYNARCIPTPGGKRQREAASPLKVGYIGTLSQIKGVAWLIRQFRKSALMGSLHIAGRGKAEDVSDLEHLALGDSRISFEGYVDPTDFYARIDALVVPSLWDEPLGMVAVEGLANNLPVIASNRGGLVETVIDGENGLLCDPDEPDSLGRALETLSQDHLLYNRLAQRARISIAPLLDTARMINEYEAVLRAVTTAHEHA